MNNRSIIRIAAVLILAVQLLTGCAHLKSPSRTEAAQVSQDTHEQHVKDENASGAYDTLYWLLQWLNFL